MDKSPEQLTKRMKTVGSRLAELDKLIQSVYEDKVAGRIEPDMAFDMLDKYQAEKKTLKAEYDEMNARCESERQDEEDVAEFISRLKRYGENASGVCFLQESL